MLGLSFLVLMLQYQELNARDTDVICDPDVPSRPHPDVNVHAIAMPQGDVQIIRCSEGEYLEWYKCSPCEEGTFRTKQMAAQDRYSWCQKCQEPGLYEIVAEPCTKSRDAKIMCEDGFYRLEVPGKPCKSECVRCDICGVGRNMFKNFEASECGGYKNTACCAYEDMVLNDG
ncbi:tumor necrosis factor receptor superfamily member 1A-like isoform X1, partial [Biomphalaria pfeifferi]